MIRDRVLPGGERIDKLAQRLYGTERDGTVEALLAANPDLAEEIGRSFIAPGGREINVPPRVDATATTTYTYSWGL